MFGNVRHAPYAVFSNASRAHNNGRQLEFMKPSECRMGGVAIQLLRVLCLRETLAECVASKAFRDLKKFKNVADIVMNERYWDLHYAVCKSLYPAYLLL